MTDPLSPAAQAVLNAVTEICPALADEIAAAALRALTRTPLVNEAHMRGWVVSAISTEDILNLAVELDGKNG